MGGHLHFKSPKILKFGWNDIMKYYNCPCGEKHPIGTKCPNKNKDINSFYWSKSWKKTRKTVLNRDHFLCQRCLLKFGKITTDHLEVHHIKKMNTNKDLALDESNLITLCLHCHRFIDGLEDGTLDFDFHISDKQQKDIDELF